MIHASLAANVSAMVSRLLTTKKHSVELKPEMYVFKKEFECEYIGNT